MDDFVDSFVVWRYFYLCSYRWRVVIFTASISKFQKADLKNKK